ncbi:MAG TPA: hypothetical protein PK950_02655, partial [Candidatus Paceibacterota bacterium]|nr:hypothetical protein [Candidatus Paceibacterota bacterium]
IMEMEEQLQDAFGTRVHIEKKEVGGKIMIDYFSPEDLHNILEMIKNGRSAESAKHPAEMLERFVQSNPDAVAIEGETHGADVPFEPAPLDDRSEDEIKQAEEEKESELYSLKDFSL